MVAERDESDEKFNVLAATFGVAKVFVELLNVKLPFALEGLSSINSNENEVLIIGGKGSNGSRKEILRYKSKELDDDYPTYGCLFNLIKFNLL